MTPYLKELERLALAASKLDHNERAEWYQPDDLLYGGPGVIYRKNSEFIAEATPTAILSLIQELEQARKDAERYRWLTDDHADAEMRDRAEDIGIRLRWIGKGSADAAIAAGQQFMKENKDANR